MGQSSEPTRQTPAQYARRSPREASDLEHGPENSAEILIFSARRQVRDRINAFLANSGCDVRAVVSATQVQALMLDGVVDLVLIDRAIGEHEAFDLCTSCAGAEPGVVTILLADNPNLDDALQAMRAGAVDLLRSDISSAQLFEHVNSGRDLARHLRKRERRALRLRGLCLRLNAARQEVSQHVGELRSDLVEASCEFHPTALASAASVDLGFDDPEVPAQRLGCFYSIVDTECRNASRHRHVELLQNLFGLVFVDFHLLKLVFGVGSKGG